MLFDSLQALIGEVPYGFEGIVYVLCVPVLLWLLAQFFGILWSILRSVARVE